jgi:hypothetical protein
MDDPDYCARVIRHRCGDEIADSVVSFEIIETIDDLAARVRTFVERVGGLSKAETCEDASRQRKAS